MSTGGELGVSKIVNLYSASQNISNALSNNGSVERQRKVVQIRLHNH